MSGIKKDRLNDAQIEAFKELSNHELDRGGFSLSNIHRSIAISNFVIIELLQRILEEMKKK